MRIAIDAHGGDFGLRPNIEGAIEALKRLDHDVLLVGRDPEIREELRRLGLENPPRLTIVHAPQVVEMGSEPVEECRTKPNSSLMVAAELVRDGKADGMISAGNSGAVMVSSLLKMKRIRGILRPALAVPYPTYKGVSVLMDAGANTDNKPWHLAQFAMMGTVYSSVLLKKDNPSVGLLSVGEEESKGNALVQETLPLLKNVGLNFYGPVEGRDLPAGLTDVVVTDGFTGNIVLKLSEGLAKVIFKLIKDQIHRKFTYKIGAMLMKKLFSDLKIRLSDDEYGGAPLLGVNGVAIICHGKSSPKAIFSAIRLAGDLAASGLAEQIARRMDAVKASMEKHADREEEEQKA